MRDKKAIVKTHEVANCVTCDKEMRAWQMFQIVLREGTGKIAGYECELTLLSPVQFACSLSCARVAMYQMHDEHTSALHDANPMAKMGPKIEVEQEP
jgi:hypothetical protein